MVFELLVLNSFNLLAKFFGRLEPSCLLAFIAQFSRL